jgi:hypothetical protein
MSFVAVIPGYEISLTIYDSSDYINVVLTDINTEIKYDGLISNSNIKIPEPRSFTFVNDTNITANNISSNNSNYNYVYNSNMCSSAYDTNDLSLLFHHIKTAIQSNSFTLTVVSSIKIMMCFNNYIHIQFFSASNNTSNSASNNTSNSVNNKKNVESSANDSISS